MPRVVERLSSWIRETTASVRATEPAPAARRLGAWRDDSLIYRLRHWPKLPPADRSIDVHRILAVMSTRPVNRRWIMKNTRLAARDVDLLLRRLTEQGAVQVIDASKFRPDANAA
jgi:hypothetical protein